MPSLVATSRVTVFKTARSLLDAYGKDLKACAGPANIILPIAEKACYANDGRNTWLIYKKSEISSPLLILSCTQGDMGAYPIFIFTPLSIAELQHEDIDGAVRELCQTLLGAVERKRVYSVFAVKPVAETFATVWSEVSGVAAIPEPYYDATFSYCTKSSITRSHSYRPDLVFELRRGQYEDIEGIAMLCRDFSRTSEPFVLDLDEAHREAQILVEKQQVWVHTVQRGDAPPEIASLVAVTRSAGDSAAITKVFTSNKWRQLGCAERLVRRVCNQLLREKERVVLYVGNNNPAAKVYGRVGFKGLGGSTPVEGVEPWSEIGFDRNQVELGQW
ncbi:hypothetical protein CONPUDRAFT_116004 [Coniophora puteana RWD-64-598 SS2]|uniref:N-acetyltransferase domain-containing protein n=1 Tax=Coniophora puteana (strain RWD-64-598) TaxID=741705 RepID=A0A5M3N6W1_CONPW|nr:uncharacterized protein CONPUDRAFT_116004 [Coniophora puteana RWD-64-598 SS2]EIW87018.1 hypothetical protein CONPUDRAFT_116004 [Coniophora puteana RWD-64-598 SS2]